MTTVKLAPIVNDTLFYPTTGALASSCFLYFYQAGTSTKQNTYTTSAGSVANSNPITLDSYGKVPSAGQVWFADGQSYKIVIAAADDTSDPPSSGVVLCDNVTGINDTGVDAAIDQWIASGLTPTYVSATSFTFTGDQTSVFHVGRRLKSTVTGGTAYSTITASVYGAVTTITVVNDSTALDSGLSAVQYSILSSVNPAIPKVVLPDGSSGTTQAADDNSTKIATTAFVGTAATTERHNSIQDFRLTLTSGTPVTTSDVTGATTIYCTPYKGNKIGLYNGTTWDVISSSEFSVALGTITSDQGYDVFCYNNSGVATLELLAWTSNTARATALVMKDGILCKTGSLTRRYMGSFLTTSTTQTEDSAAKRYLYNYYHRAKKKLSALESTASWTYSTATWRQANASTTNQLNVFIGVVEYPIYATVSATAYNSNAGDVDIKTSIGLNSTSSPYGLIAYTTSYSSHHRTNICTDNIIPILGKNYIAWLEYSGATATTTWFGLSAGSIQSGIIGYTWC